MIPGATDGVPLVDRLIALFELSRLGAVPSGLTILTVGPIWVGTLALALFGGKTFAMLMLVVLVVWLVLIVLDLGRGIWSLRHPYASPRWLRAVSAAIGEDVSVHALARLIRQHDHDPDYAMTRHDMANAVRTERAARRNAARRAEGFRLVDAPAAAQSVVDKPGSLPFDRYGRISDEQRQRARERRAARRGAVNP